MNRRYGDVSNVEERRGEERRGEERRGLVLAAPPSAGSRTPMFGVGIVRLTTEHSK